MLQNKANVKSDYQFILNYTADEIDGIIDDLKLFADGYEFLYTVDIYDILENYLPYTQVELFSKDDRLFQAQKFVCYDYFFGSNSRTRSILLDEYRIELIAAKNKLTKNLRETRIVLKNLDELKKQTDDFIHSAEKVEEFFCNNFEVIILLLILNEKTSDVLNDFISFIRDRLDIDSVKVFNDIHNEQVNAVFSDVRCTRFSIEIFESYIHRNKAQLLSVQNPDERHIFLENTFRDVQAIERVMSVNRHFEQGDLKYVVVYLSSARKTVELFKAVDALRSNNAAFQFPLRNTHRNINQYFLFDILKNEFKNDLNKAISLLSKLKETIIKLNSSAALSNEESLPDEYQHMLQIVKQLHDEKSRVLDNHFYADIYNKYRKTFDELINIRAGHAKKSIFLDKGELQQILQEIDKRKDSYKSAVNNIEFTLSLLNQTYNIVETVSNIDSLTPEHKSGKDIVQNPHHHLPLLPFIGSEIPPLFKHVLYSFLDKTLESESEETNKSELKSSLEEVINLMPELSSSKIANRFLTSFVTSYLNLVAQQKIPVHRRKTSKTSDVNTEESLISDLEKQYQVIKYYYSKGDLATLAQAKQVDIKFQQHFLLGEISYVLIWLYRRNNREEYVLENKCEYLQFETDPRMFHGVALCYVAKLYKLILESIEGDSIIEKKLFTESLHHLHKAQSLYKNMFEKSDNSLNKSLLRKNYVAVLNTIADLKVREFERYAENNSCLLTDARTCVDEIKSEFRALGLNYRKHLIYVSTELELELLEAQQFLYLGDIQKAHEKIRSVHDLHSHFKDSESNKLANNFFRLPHRKINAVTNDIITLLSKKS